jgi:predicted nuclease with TOPRIM domain
MIQYYFFFIFFYTTFVDDLHKLQLELSNVKDRFDRTESDNVILGNRIDILSHENYQIRGQLRRMSSMENKMHKTFKEVIEKTDSVDGYPDQGFQYGDAKTNTEMHLTLPELGQILNNKFNPKYDRDLEDSSKIIF